MVLRHLNIVTVLMKWYLTMCGFTDLGNYIESRVGTIVTTIIYIMKTIAFKSCELIIELYIYIYSFGYQ